MLRQIETFISYSHQDNDLRQEFEAHLALLRRQALLAAWHDRMIAPGDNWKGHVDSRLNRAELVLLLVSADFLASDYCYDCEMKRALERHKGGEARVIPILLRPCDWKTSELGGLHSLPRDGVPVTTWRNRDEAWVDVVEGLRSALLLHEIVRPESSTARAPSQSEKRPFVHTSQTADGILQSMLPLGAYGVEDAELDDDTGEAGGVYAVVHCPSSRHLSQPSGIQSFTIVTAMCLAYPNRFILDLKRSSPEILATLDGRPSDMRSFDRAAVARTISASIARGFFVSIAIPKSLLDHRAQNLKLSYQTITSALLLPLLSAHRRHGSAAFHLRVSQAGERDSALLQLAKTAVKATFGRRGTAEFSGVEGESWSNDLARVTRFVAWAVGRHYNSNDGSIIRLLEGTG
jgi:hypothetical protein